METTQAEFIAEKALQEKALADALQNGNQKSASSIGKQLQRIDRILDLFSSVQILEKDVAYLSDVIAGDDSELAALAADELDAKKLLLEKTRVELEDARAPRDPKDDRDCIVEIRAGAGGDEAGLFAAELFRLYTRFAEQQGWKTHIDSTNRTGIGGYKEVVFEIHGNEAYGNLKFESGVHRVQRVPETEKSGRVHTSTTTVVVLPIVEEKEVTIKPEDVKIEATTASGHGGQSVNTTYSAIRMTHLPTGVTVSCQDERSQKQNKEKAMQILRSRVFALEEQKRQAEETRLRKGQIGTGDRSEKIRTYNFPQDRLTDHRIKENFHNLADIMEGNISPLIDALKKYDRNLRTHAA